MGGAWTLILMAILLASFFPVLGQKQMEEEGVYCNHNLEIIFAAKTMLAEDLNVFSDRSPERILKEITPGDLKQYLEDLAEGRDLNCPSGGVYTIRPLVDAYGEVVAPICDYEEKDNDSDGNSNGVEGYHIHRQSYLRDVQTGRYYRDPAFSFSE